MPTGSFDINELKRRMQGATQSLKHETGAVCETGPRRGPSMLEAGAGRCLTGTHMPLNQLADPIRCGRSRALALGAGMG